MEVVVEREHILYSHIEERVRARVRDRETERERETERGFGSS